MRRLPDNVFASLEEAAEALGWTEERLALATTKAASPRPERITERDRERARVLADQLRQTREALGSVA